MKFFFQKWKLLKLFKKWKLLKFFQEWKFLKLFFPETKNCWSFCINKICEVFPRMKISETFFQKWKLSSFFENKNVWVFHKIRKNFKTDFKIETFWSFFFKKYKNYWSSWWTNKKIPKNCWEHKNSHTRMLNRSKIQFYMSRLLRFYFRHKICSQSFKKVLWSCVNKLKFTSFEQKPNLS